MNDFNIESILGDLVPSVLDNAVAVEPDGEGSATAYIRKGDSITLRKVPFSPFLLLTDKTLMDGFTGTSGIDRLGGDLTFRYVVRFPNEAEYEKGIKHLYSATRKSAAAQDSPYRIITDIQQQIMIQSGIRLFRSMKFDDVRRLQFDIETLSTEGFDFPNPTREDDRIIVITMSDNTGWEKCLFADNGKTEKDLLEEFVISVRERDPDIMEGHNIFRFDLPFIGERARRHKVKLSLGRDNSIPQTRNSRFSVAERTLNYKRYDICGRHIVDTNFLAMLYDVSHRSLESLGLKAIAKHFKVASDSRTYIDAGNIGKYYRDNKTDLLNYAMDDVRETRAISAILSPSYFYQTQLQPYSYQNSIIRGNATKIDSILVASYIAAAHSIPNPEPPVQIPGALTEAFHSGIFENVWHCDIRSLYPSIILADKLRPSRDPLDRLSFFLVKLREARLTAKDMERKAGSAQDKDHYNSLQTSFKIMINSFYGYLACAQGSFNDYKMAEQITSKGREILSLMQNTLSESGAKVIEMDTDGIYFQPPEKISREEMKNKIQSVLPLGIEVEFDSEYEKMFCYKSKNYALLSSDGEVSIAGAALKSRGVEPFIRRYLSEFIHLLLDGKKEEIIRLTEKYRNDISSSFMPLESLAKTETLNESPANYKAKLSSGTSKRSAAYELASGSKREYRQGDQITYYITGNKKSISAVDNCRLLSDAPEIRDENIPYYLAKLDEIFKRFKPFI